MKHTISSVRPIVIGLVLFCLFWGNASLVSAQQVSRIVAVSVGDVNGTVEVLSREDIEKQKGKPQILSTLWKAAAPQTSINQGDQLRTGIDASLQLHLNDGTILNLAGDSLLMVDELRSGRGTTPRTIVFSLEKGTISTQQTTKTLGQTVQVIRTNNGSVDTQMGEVEIYKPQHRDARLASTAAQWPLLAQRAGEKDQTLVNVLRGTAQVESTGQGQIITNSTLLPNTCVGNDGVQFTLHAPKSRVKIAKLPDINGFELASVSPAREPFQLLVGTEGQANKIKIMNHTGIAEVAIEDIKIAEQDPNSTLQLLVDQVLTVGVKSSEMAVALECTQRESKGLGFEVLSTNGGVTMSRRSLGPAPGFSASHGAIPAVATRTPGPWPTARPTTTPTKTPKPEATVPAKPTKTPKPGTTDTPTPKPTFTPSRPTVTPTATPGKPTATPTLPPPPPTKIPVTHTQSRYPVIWDAFVDAAADGACGSDYTVTLNFHFTNYLPNITPGQFSGYVTDSQWIPYSPIYRPLDLHMMTNYQYDDAQLEKGDLSYTFCYNTRPDIGDVLYVYFFIYDSEGNRSNKKKCAIRVPASSVPCQ